MNIDGDVYEFVGPNSATIKLDRVTTVISGVFGKHTAPQPRVNEGVRAHSFLEALATNDGHLVEPETGFQEGVLAWFRYHKPEVIASELTVVDPILGFAGTVDLIVANEFGWTIIDLKTRRETWTKSFLTDKIQVQAYRSTFPNSLAYNTGVLLARSDGSYVYDPEEVGEDVWLSTLALYRAMQASGVTIRD